MAGNHKNADCTICFVPINFGFLNGCYVCVRALNVILWKDGSSQANRLFYHMMLHFEHLLRFSLFTEKNYRIHSLLFSYDILRNDFLQKEVTSR